MDSVCSKGRMHVLPLTSFAKLPFVSHSKTITFLDNRSSQKISWILKVFQLNMQLLHKQFKKCCILEKGFSYQVKCRVSTNVTRNLKIKFIGFIYKCFFLKINIFRPCEKQVCFYWPVSLKCLTLKQNLAFIATWQWWFQREASYTNKQKSTVLQIFYIFLV